MYDKKKIRTISNFICPECGLNFPLPRNHGRQRKNGHIKDIYIVRNATKYRNFGNINTSKVIRRWMVRLLIW